MACAYGRMQAAVCSPWALHIWAKQRAAGFGTSPSMNKPATFQQSRGTTQGGASSPHDWTGFFNYALIARVPHPQPPNPISSPLFRVSLLPRDDVGRGRRRLGIQFLLFPRSTAASGHIIRLTSNSTRRYQNEATSPPHVQFKCSATPLIYRAHTSPCPPQNPVSSWIRPPFHRLDPLHDSPPPAPRRRLALHLLPLCSSGRII